MKYEDTPEAKAWAEHSRQGLVLRAWNVRREKAKKGEAK